MRHIHRVDDESELYLDRCDGGRDHQRFRLLTDGRILGPEARCVEVLDGIDVSGTPIVIRECEDVPQHRWTLRQPPATLRTQGGQFDDGSLSGSHVNAQSLAFGDIDGDGDQDACIRRADGVWCARGQGTGRFAGWSRWSTDFSDAQLWDEPQYGTTLRLGDIDRDGDDDLCGRGIAGLYCAISDRTRFARHTLWSDDFSDDDGYDHPSRYLSFALADVDGDGDDDACMRSHDGVHCLRALSASFGSDELWLGDVFVDGEGWGSSDYGGSLRFGDLDADGRADVCGRGSNKVMCAKSDGVAFVRPSTWGFRTNFSNEDGWESTSRIG